MTEFENDSYVINSIESDIAKNDHEVKEEIVFDEKDELSPANQLFGRLLLSMLFFTPFHQLSGLLTGDSQ